MNFDYEEFLEEKAKDEYILYLKKLVKESKRNVLELKLDEIMAAATKVADEMNKKYFEANIDPQIFYNLSIIEIHEYLTDIKNTSYAKNFIQILLDKIDRNNAVFEKIKKNKFLKVK